MSSKGECDCNNNCSRACLLQGMTQGSPESPAYVLEQVIFFTSWLHVRSGLWRTACICVCQVVCTWCVTAKRESKSKKFFLCPCLPHKKKSFESSTGVLVFPELRYSRVCFIMVLGLEQPECIAPKGESALCTNLSVPSPRNAERDTRPLLLRPPSYSEFILNWWRGSFFFPP